MQRILLRDRAWRVESATQVAADKTLKKAWACCAETTAAAQQTGDAELVASTQLRRTRSFIQEDYAALDPPLRQSATDTLNRQLGSGISDDKLADLVMALRDDDRLCILHEEDQIQKPQIICSMGLSEEAQS